MWRRIRFPFRDRSFLAYPALYLKKGETLLATLVNCSLERDYALEIELPHWSCRQCEGEILTGEIHSRNTFDAPCAVLPQAFTDFQIEDGRLRLTLPRASVVSLTLAP